MRLEPSAPVGRAGLAGAAPADRAISPVHVGIVVPCYNEEAVLPETASRLCALLDDLVARGVAHAESAVYFVDDGSRDRTWALTQSLSAAHPRIHGLKLSRNRGHQNALLAGLFNAPGEVLISVDADLQDDLAVIANMLDAYREGAEIVFGVRQSRSTDTLFKRASAEAYYKLLRAMGVDLVFNHADYRLMSRRVVDCLADYGEVNLFLRGIVPQIGFRTAQVTYDRAERFAGESKYPLRKMLAFALDGITSFSVVPLRLLTTLGLFFAGLSLFMVLWVLYGTLVLKATVPGWASSVIPIYFLGGVQLLGMGILGEYVAKIYLETKRRPRFVVEDSV